MHLTPGTLARIAYNVDNESLRGRAVQIVGQQSPATFMDVARVPVRIIESDGSLGETWRIRPNLLIAV